MDKLCLQFKFIMRMGNIIPYVKNNKIKINMFNIFGPLNIKE